ncbi:hypothetical protein NMY22_g4004 [Coprinellus aureogranulatus]|nr:hypothetical protein NMY22_g4004 [Coprinellus aureogranulatus]
MSSGATAQDKAWKDRESASEASYIHDKVRSKFLYREHPQPTNNKQEREQLEAIRAGLDHSASASGDASTVAREDRPYEAGFGGQEDLEDRYATTSGEH